MAGAGGSGSRAGLRDRRGHRCQDRDTRKPGAGLPGCRVTAGSLDAGVTTGSRDAGVTAGSLDARLTVGSLDAR